MNFFGALSLLVLGFVGLVLLGVRKSRKVGIVLLIFSIGVSGHFIWQTQMWSDKYGLIKLGDNQVKVRQLMGAPTFLAATPADTQERSNQFGANPVAGCVKEYLYMAFFLPRVWVFCFDANGTVIDEYVLDSY